MSRILIYLFTVILAISFSGCAKINNSQSGSTPSATAVILITEQNNGQTVSLKQNNIFRLTLKDPGDGGYQFANPTYDSSIIELIDQKQIKATSGMTGDFGSDQWTFRALKSGTTNLRLDIYRSWEQEKIKNFAVNIKVN